jgi:hypothetical protein
MYEVPILRITNLATGNSEARIIEILIKLVIAEGRKEENSGR